MQKLIYKTLASLLVLTLIFSYFPVIGIYGSEVLASSIEDQNSQTEIENVEFDTRFSNGSYRLEADINSQNEQLVFGVRVHNTGYIKDAQIKLEGANFEITSEELPEGVEQIDKESKTINLSIVKAGETVQAQVPIQAIKTDRIQPEMLGKDTVVKFTATYVDEDGKEKKVEKELINQLIWTGTANVIANQNLTKYIPFETETEKGLIMQTAITSGLENNILPFQSTEILAKVSPIAETNPSKVFVEAKGLTATNGNKEEIKLPETNYQYDQETNTLRIFVENTKAEDGTVAWEKTGHDQYIITYIFLGDAVYEATKSMIAEDFETDINITAFDGTKLTTNIGGTIDLKEGLGQVVDFESRTNETTLSKGYAYANYANPEVKVETEYTQIISANTSYINLVDNLELRQNSDLYVDEREKEYDSLDIYNKKIIISESNFLSILGEEGWIEIYNPSGEKIYTINKEIGEKQKDEQGNYYIDTAEQGIDNFTFKTSKPVQEGKLEITIQKAIKTDMQYKRSQLEIVRAIKTELKGIATLGETAAKVTETESESRIEFTEPVTKAEISIDKTELSTAVVNEDVGITVTLITDSTDDALFKNPTLNIKLPDPVESINVKDINLIYGDGELAIANYQYNENTKTLIVQLEGIQNKYAIGAISKGTVIAITADIGLTQITADQDSKIELHYTNGNSDLFEVVDENGLGYAETAVKVIAPSGLVTVNAMEGYSEQETGVQSISSGEEQVGILSINDGIKKAKVIGKVINNLGNTAKNVSILGRTPFKGNKTIDAGKDLGTNIDTTVLTPITLEGAEAQIYYSENGEATNDLDLESNGWVAEPENFAKVKSYLIVLNGDLAEGSLLTFYYDVEIPANLPYECAAYTTYKVYYNNNTEVGQIPQASVATTTGVTTQEGPKFETNLVADVPNADDVREGQIVKFYLTVKNTGKKEATNTKITVPIPPYAEWVSRETSHGFYSYSGSENIIYEVGTIPVGGTVTEVFFLKMSSIREYAPIPEHEHSSPDTVCEYAKLEEEKKAGEAEVAEKGYRTVKITGNVISSELTEAFAIESNSLRLKKGNLLVTFVGDWGDRMTFMSGANLSGRILVNATGVENIKNAVVTVNLPNGLTCIDAYKGTMYDDPNKTTEGIVYDESANTLTVKYSELGTEEQQIYFRFNVNSSYTGEIDVYATATGDGVDKCYSNLETILIEKNSIEISELTTSQKYVKEQEEFTYNITITNTSNATIAQINVIDQLPNELQLIEAYYASNGGVIRTSSSSNGKFTLAVRSLGAGEKAEIVVRVKSKLLSEEKDVEIQNKVTVNGSGLDELTSNTVTNVIEYVSSLHRDPIPGGGTPVETKYKISGTAWLDENSDGKKDSEETTLAGIKAILLNKSDYSIVTDTTSKKEKIVTTSEDGKYEFSNLSKGEYIVAYIFDSGVYELTTYHKEGVEEGYNSDAIAMDITYEDEMHKGAATDIIKITNENAREIDIGLVTTEKFDLRLDKYITKISVTATEGERTYNYNNANFTKIELPSSAIEGSTVVVEYKIIVKNEGGVAGYAKKIIDYIPSGMKFNSNLNSDWYLASDGNVYNTTLENTELKPGESKELTIILTKKLTENNLGTITNYAEIFESYNARALEDIDSNAGNKVQTEDDFSTASVTVTVITGKVISFIGISLLSITIIALGAYGIKKFVIKKI